MTRAFGYVRLSKETEDTTSPQRQRKAIEKLVTDRGWELAERFEDIDVSAYNGKHRPGFEQMMARLDEVDAIVFWKLDRLSRSTAQAAQIAETCKAAGVHLVATDMDIDTTTAGGKLVYDILMAAGEFTSSMTSERSRHMMAYKLANDEWVGRVPFGWKLVGKHLDRDEAQQAILRDAAARYVGGESFSSIARGIIVQTKDGPRPMQTAVLSRIQGVKQADPAPSRGGQCLSSGSASRRSQYSRSIALFALTVY